jgi:hypothetical protein
MCIMGPVPISTAYFTNPSHYYVCMCLPPIADRQQLGKHVPAATKTHKNRIVGRVCLWVCLCIPL